MENWRWGIEFYDTCEPFRQRRGEEENYGLSLELQVFNLDQGKTHTKFSNPADNDVQKFFIYYYINRIFFQKCCLFLVFWLQFWGKRPQWYYYLPKFF